MNGYEMAFIHEAIASNWVAPLGRNVDMFEQEVAQFVRVDHAAALCSGTAALHLAVKLAGVRPGDIVFCSDLTFVASVNPVLYEGGVPVFIDSEEESWNMDPDALALAFERWPEAKAVIAVDLYGSPGRMDEIAALCRRYGAVLIEDAAEALGATYRGQAAGTFGDFGIFSFNGNKIITTSGGGMLVSGSRAAVARARFLASQAKDPTRHYEHRESGYNYRMSNIAAGIGRGQMKTLDEYIQRKEALYQRYSRAFADLPCLSMNPWLNESRPNFWLSCLRLQNTSVTPMQIIEALERDDIEARPLWKPMHLQPLFASCALVSRHADAASGASVSGTLFEQGLCLPSDIKMTDADAERVIRIVRGCFSYEGER
ncbi:DegT/DnrJ/EryC1/StrS family aminotransferase [Mailhella sp.]|uniref:DegT/DnrJ/EryC1/StrS family aminotransferase n=1 Tax=Mailhella sp. TaxID=1981029 RepID=UPI0040632080